MTLADVAEIVNRSSVAFSPAAVSGRSTVQLRFFTHGGAVEIARAQTALTQVLGRQITNVYRVNHFGAYTYRLDTTGFERVQAVAAALWPWLNDGHRADARALLELHRRTWRPRGRPRKGTEERPRWIWVRPSAGVVSV